MPSRHTQRLVGLTLLMLLIGVAAACAPAPAPPPTLAMLPTNTPIPTVVIPTPIPTLPPTFTPVPTSTPAPTRTPRPTATDLPDTTDADCAALLAIAAETMTNFCAQSPVDEVCYGSALLSANTFTNEANRLRGVGDILPIDDITWLNTAPIELEGAIYGGAIARLGNDLNGPYEGRDALTLMMLGGATVENLVPNTVLQQEIIDAQPANNRDELELPFTRISITTESAAETCAFVPNGVLLQAPRQSRLTVNGTDLDFNGTLWITASAREMTVSNLNGSATWFVGPYLRELPLGTGASIPLNLDLTPVLDAPPTVQSLQPVQMRGLFEGDTALITALPQPISAPAYLQEEELVRVSTYNGNWRMGVEIKQLAGIYSAGTPLNDDLIQQAIGACPWPGVSLLGQTVDTDISINQSADQQSLFMQANYPGLSFPTVWTRTPDNPNVYSGEFVATDGGRYVHTISFNSEMAFVWRVEMSGLTGGVCDSGTLEASGTRMDVPAPTPETRIGGGVPSQTWQVTLNADTYFIPDNQPLPDCDEAATYNLPVIQTLISTQRDDANGTLAIQTSFQEDTPMPPALTVSPNNPNVYLGEITQDNTRYVHRVTATESALTWRVMIQSLNGACRLGSFEANGFPFDAS